MFHPIGYEGQHNNRQRDHRGSTQQYNNKPATGSTQGQGYEKQQPYHNNKSSSLAGSNQAQQHRGQTGRNKTDNRQDDARHDQRGPGRNERQHERNATRKSDDSQYRQQVSGVLLRWMRCKGVFQ